VNPGSKATPFADGKTGLMTKQDRQGRVIASAVFVSLFFIWGSGYETFPIFFPALLNNFGWSKARLGLMSMGFSVDVILGLGLGASTFVPAALVIANWFDERLGLVGQ
jgi:hypothetical protein